MYVFSVLSLVTHVFPNCQFLCLAQQLNENTIWRQQHVAIGIEYKQLEEQAATTNIADSSLQDVSVYGLFVHTCCRNAAVVVSSFFYKSWSQYMSQSLSVLALFVASCTWWTQPASPQVFEVSPQPPAEFSCSARCAAPSPSPAVLPASGGGSWETALGFLAGALVCVVLVYHCTRRSPTVQIHTGSVATSGQEPVVTRETEPQPQLAIEGPFTPALRRQLRLLKNAA